jgi:hypothetical protein
MRKISEIGWFPKTILQPVDVIAFVIGQRSYPGTCAVGTMPFLIVKLFRVIYGRL